MAAASSACLQPRAAFKVRARGGGTPRALGYQREQGGLPPSVKQCLGSTSVPESQIRTLQVERKRPAAMESHGEPFGFGSQVR
jgi:hypothetical protein